MREGLRKSGIDIIGDVPWGTHFCQFYQTKEDLIDILIPYFKGGLENNEFCIWVTSQPLEVEEAKEALRSAIPDIDLYLEKGQIEIIPHTYMCLKEDNFDSESFLNSLVEKLNNALEYGYDGLRLSVDNFWREERNWSCFAGYEEEIADLIANYQMIALCTYSLDTHSTAEIIDVAIDHQFVLIKKEGKWQLTESSRCNEEECRIRRYNRVLEGINRIFSSVVKAETEEELGNECLSVALEITGSQFGFINEIEDDGLMHDVAKSELAWEKCLMYDRTGHRRPPSDFVIHGLYGSVIINEKSFFTNDPPSHPDSIGLPEGHPHLTSFLGVPLVFDGQIIGLIAVANRDGGYSFKQQEDLEAIAPAVAQVLQRQKTEQKQKEAEKALQVSEARYRSLYENSLDGILLTKPDSTILSANPEACHMFGMTEEEIKRVGREGVVVNDDKLTAALEERKRTGRMRAELTHRRKDGSTFVCDTTSQLFIDADGSTSTSLIIRDITERKRAEEALLESESRLRLAQVSAGAGIWDWDTSTNKFEWSEELFHLFGLDPWKTDANLDSWRSVLHPDDSLIAEKRIEAAINNHTPLVSEYRIMLPSGEVRWINALGNTTYDSDGKPQRMSGICIDITKRKKAEEALRFSNIYNRSLIEASLDPMVTIGHDGKITDVNGATEQVTGYSRSELIGTDFSDYFTEPEKARAGYKQAFMDGEVRDYPLGIQHKEGHITPVLYNASVYRDENGKIIGVFAAARDITESIKAKEKIQILANAVESSDDAIITRSLDGIITSWNKGAEKVYGYSAEEVVGKPISILEPDGRKGEIKLFSERVKQGDKIQHYETSRLKKDGTTISVSVTLSPVFDTSGELVAVSTIARDVTERKKAEEALRLSNLYNRSLIEASLDPLVTIGPDGKITDVNAATEIATGYSRDELIGTDFSDYFTEPEKAKKGYQQVFKEGSVFDYELEIQNRNGSITPVLYNASVYKDESGKVTGIFAAARDIKERKKAEEALKRAHDSLEEKVKERTAELEEAYESLLENERRLNEAQKTAHIGYWDWDIVNDKIYLSDEIYRILGMTPRESLSYSEAFSAIHPCDRDYLSNTIKDAFNGKPYDVEYRIVLANGEERIVHVQAEVIFDKKNIPVQIRGIVQDITERKRAEDKIQILANAVESSNDAIVTESLDGTITSWNKAAEQIYGYSAEEILGKNVSILEPDNVKGEIQYFSEKIKQGKKVQNYETIRLRKDGSIINISVTLSPIFNASGELVALSAIVRDITERKREEKALRESEARLRRFYESGMFGVVYYGMDGSITDANDKFLEMVGYTREDLQAGQVNWKKITPPEYRLLDVKCMAELKATGIYAPYEKEYIHQDGSHVPVIVGAATFDQESHDGIAFILDNTERKKTEKTLAEIDRIRIKEIHHRIKNNLQVISSLLDLQAEKFDDEKVKEAFREGQNRVASMSLIHEELYKGKGKDTLDFSVYLRKLAENLFQTYSLRSKNISLSMDLEEGAFFNMDTAIPLGIIVNELVSNSLKHAFNEEDKGEIRVQLCRKKEKNEIDKSSFILTISDNGKGIPETVKFENFESLGLQLVSTLVDQLEGKIEINRNQGIEFRISFNVVENRKSE